MIEHKFLISAKKPMRCLQRGIYYHSGFDLATTILCADIK